jgi:hypothetical protein
MLLVEELNHDNKPKAHFWEPNIIARTDDPFWYSPIDHPLFASSMVAANALPAASYVNPYRLLLEREEILA